MSRKSLTFKSPDRMKVLVLILLVALILSPTIRNTTATILHTVADIISTQ